MAALDSHCLGQFQASGVLLESMLADETFDSVMHTRVIGLLGKPLRLRANRHPDKDAAAACLRAVEDRRETLFAEAALSNLMLYAIGMGFSVSQLLWDYDGECVTPSLQSWHPSQIYYMLPDRRYIAITMDGIRHIVPGDGQWLLHAPFGSYRGWMRGAVRSCALPYLAITYARRDWSRYNEVHGLPIRLLKFPAEAAAREKQAVFNALSNLGNETTISLPQGAQDNPIASWDVDLLEATSQSWTSFEHMISSCQDRIAIRILGQNLTTAVSGGSFAAADVHDSVRSDYVQADARSLASTLRKQLLEPFAAHNFGDASLAPEVYFDVTPAEDKSALATTYATALQAASVAAAAGLPIDVRAMLQKLGVPLRPERLATPTQVRPPNDRPVPPVAVGPSAGVASLSACCATDGTAHELSSADVVVAPEAPEVLSDAILEGVDAGTAAMQPALDAVLAAVSGSTSLHDARAAVLALADSLDPSDMAGAVGTALRLAAAVGAAGAGKTK